MYQDIHIENFKCFRSLDLKGFERVNLIAGKNGAGKTSLLEAIFFYGMSFNPTAVLHMMRFRKRIPMTGDPNHRELPMIEFFNNFNFSSTINMEAKIAEKLRSFSLNLVRHPDQLTDLSANFQKAGIFTETLDIIFQTSKIFEVVYKDGDSLGKCHLVFSFQGKPALVGKLPQLLQSYIIIDSNNPNESEVAFLFGQLVKQGRKQELIEIIRIVEPRIKDLEIIPEGDLPIIHADLGMNQMVALSLIGSGAVRIAYIAIVLLLFRNEDAVVMFDEIENGLHYSLLVKLWEAIGDAARKNNVQVFATTHSYECIQAAHAAFSKTDPYDFRLHRLDRRGEDIVAVNYSKEGLRGAIELNFEVR